MQLDDQRAGGDQSSSTFGHELQDQSEIGLAADRARNLDHHPERINGLLELLPARLRAAVAPRMIDRDSGELREPHHTPLVVSRELTTALLLSEIQVAERLTPNHHRDPQEALHRGMPNGKPIRPRVLPDIRDTQRRGIADQLAKHTVTCRRRPDPAARRLLNTDRDEPRQRRPGLIENPDRGVPSPRQLPSRLKNTLEHSLKIQIAKHAASNIKRVPRRHVHHALH